jgi:hypothetical protein
VAREVPGWLRAVQAFEWLFLLVGAGLVLSGLAPRLGVAVVAVTAVVAVAVQARLASLRQDP